MSQKILAYSFYLLFFLTPLIFTPFNNELFEYNKMMLVYTLTVLIVAAWIIKIINHKSLIINRTPLDIPILLFLASQILSTIFSIDRHTSLWGYYSRSNGGLLSIISYILLYYAVVSNFQKEDIIKFLKAALVGGFLVSLYAIPEHFGVSPSCVLLVQRVAADCWVQDVQARVFATLGQPNWLAAYLAMLIFPTIYFITQAKTLKSKLTYYSLLATFYMAFTFTYSRGATLGLIGGLGVFFLGYLFCHPEAKGRRISDLVSAPSSSRIREGFLPTFGMTGLKPLLLASCLLLLINLLFGSALTGGFRLIKQAAPPPRPGISFAQSIGGTQLENGGTESGQIRLIVWKGALEIFKHYPILGSGVETFAYSYYNFRPIEHNFVSEWDFLYNKAHNEYLNYLATTGALGFGTYMLMIGIFIYWCARWVMGNGKGEKHITHHSLLITSLLASNISYLIQNFFLFSVVIVALFFYLFPAFAFVVTDSTKPLQRIPFFSFIPNVLYKRDLYQKILKVLIILICIYFLILLRKLWIADTKYKIGSDSNEGGNPGRAYNNLIEAVNLNPFEPLYRNELGNAAASAAFALQEEDATTSAQLKDEAIEQTEKSLSTSPKNISLLKTAIRTYFQLYLLDPSFEGKTLEIVDKSIALAPTDPKLLYNKGLIYSQMEKYKEATEEYKKAIALRPKYREAYLSLGEAYAKLGEKDKAKKAYQEVLNMIPDDPDAVKLMEELGESSR